MAIPVKLPVFEGQLDLLLHLIDKNKIDIYDIPIVEITDQYLEYIHQMEREDLEAIAEVLRGTNIMVLSDEIYAELNYGLRPHVSIASLPGMAERTVVVNGFSKSYAMTGWRLGYACGPEAVIKIMTKIHQSAIMSAPTTSQYAAMGPARGGYGAALWVLLALSVGLPLWLDGSFGPLAAAVGYGLAVWYGFRNLDGMSGDISGFALTIGELCGCGAAILWR